MTRWHIYYCTTKVILLLMAVLMVSCVTQEKNVSMQSAMTHREQSIEVIMKTQTWISDASYGFSGELENKAATAIRVLANEPDATSVFVELLSEAPLAGQLYALCGLHRINQSVFREHVDRYHSMTNTIPSIHADVHWEDKVCDIVRTPRENTEEAIRAVLAPGETLGEWVAKNIRGKTEYFYVDIVGGGYPSKFLDGWRGLPQ